MANPTGKGGFQERRHQINRKGRPRSFDALRELALVIAHEVAVANGSPIVINAKTVTVAEAILRSWATSKNPQLQRAFIEIAFGKVPDVHVFDTDRNVEVVVNFNEAESGRGEAKDESDD